MLGYRLVAATPDRSSQRALDRPNRRAISEWALSQIYEAIVSGEIARGEPVREEDLCRRLSISRSPVRQALRQLEADGLVDVVGGGGQRAVREFDVDDVRDIYTVRAALEALGHRLAADRLEPETVRRLDAITDAIAQATLDTPEERRAFFALDIEAHSLVCAAAGSPRLEQLVRPLLRQTRALITHLDAEGIYPTQAELASVAADHRVIVDALHRRAGMEAGEAVQRHLESRRDRLATLLVERGLFGGTRSYGTAR